jgi:hypothetical protein
LVEERVNRPHFVGGETLAALSADDVEYRLAHLFLLISGKGTWPAFRDTMIPMFMFGSTV